MTHFYEPARGHGLAHDPFSAIVGPRPIGWMSTIDDQGRVNLAPYSFFNAFNYKPPIVGFASIGWKHTVRNIKQTGEFVYNLATRALAEQMNQTSATVPDGVDEFELAGLKAEPSRLVKPPRVGGTPAALECKLVQLIQLQGLDGQPVETWLVLGEVVGVHIEPAYLRDGVYDTAAAEPILRAGRQGDYARVSADRMFEMPRPG